MSTGGDRTLVLRVAALGMVTLGALAAVADWSFPSIARRAKGGGIELVIASVDRGNWTPIDEALPPSAAELRFAGVVQRRCNLFVFGLTASGLSRRIHVGGDDAPGAPVGPGEFRLPGGHVFEVPPRSAVRFWAVCGPEDLRYADLVAAARAEVDAKGSGVEGVTGADRLTTLPETVLQTSRLVRSGF